MAKLFIVASSSVLVAATALAQEASALASGITLAGAIATALAALFVGIVNVMAARAAARKAMIPVMEKVNKIEAHVNSESTRYQGVIATQKQEIELQREMIDEMRKAAALLAQAKQATDLTQAVAQAAVAGATGLIIPVAPPVVAQPVLKAIQQNTEETARNTKKTDETVQELKDQA